MSKVAVILFNLGGPDGPEAVQPFLFNLFNDPAIIPVPGPLRWLLAKVISARRAPIAREIYQNLGGGSPLLANTEAQADALISSLQARRPEDVFQVAIAMRYWHPRAPETVDRVKAFAPDQIVLLPLYPQHSTTTVASSVKEWLREASKAGLAVPTTTLCCYPCEPGFIAAVAERLRPLIEKARAAGPPRLLFSAHGLPKKVVDGGDPYQWQVERTAAAVAEALAVENLDWLVCYQSRVGPLEWIGPSTDDQIERAGRDGVPLVVCPIAFVSEHSETLVELDIEYGALAERSGVPAYHRAATVDTMRAFIDGLAGLVERAIGHDGALCSGEGGRICPAAWARCPMAIGS